MTEADVNVLVIDDVNSMRIQVRELLKTFGFRNVQVAGAPDEALALLEAESFHLVLCDWHMSPFDGLELLKYVRKSPKLANIAFVMVTAENTREQVIAAIQAGVDDYLMKPLTIGHIKTKVFGALQKRKVLG